MCRKYIYIYIERERDRQTETETERERERERKIERDKREGGRQADQNQLRYEEYFIHFLF